ncbi:MAG: UbiD family decarboxylase [Chloroflexi bacterium]|nr:UbiD family decarboxylase [Chloroflexota bacterium]
MGVDYEDLRQWLAKVEEIGELKIAKSIDLKEDTGRIAEIAASMETAPSIVLDEFPGFEPGYRILINPYGSIRQIAITFGFPLVSDRKSLLEHFKKKLAGLKLIPPEYVDTGPIFENQLTGNQVDLNRFPVPMWHRQDGGPYIGTGCMVITRDPDEGWVNVGTYRNQLLDKKTVGFFSSRVPHGYAHRQKYIAKGKPCPVAIVFGSDPLLFAGGMTDLPWGVSELDWVGGWRGSPVKVIKGPVTGLPIPAAAEIAIEGFSYPGKTRLEGPFGEWMGYYASGSGEAPYVDVEAVYFRNDPILLGVPSEKPPYDADKARQYIESALVFNELKQTGIQGISNIWCYGEGACKLLTAVAIKQQFGGHSRQVGHAVYAITGSNVGKLVVVVDEDIDVTDLKDVLWAVLTRCDPATSVDIIRRARTSALDALVSPEDRTAGRYMNSRAIIDATMPFEWKDKFPMPVQSDQEYRRESWKRFAHLFKT